MGTDVAAIQSKYAYLSPRLREALLSETPRHRVTVAPFYMDACEVTNRDFQAFLNASPEWRPGRVDPRTHNGDYLKHWVGQQFPKGQADFPVVFVSWYAAMAYSAWSGKRLPTEAEWECAARGGLAAAEYPWGDDPPTPGRANYAASGLGTAAPVGRYPPNPLGLYDMAGNVWEFCLDEWQPDYSHGRHLNHQEIASLVTDFRSVTTRRVIRGGSWGGSPLNLRVAYRDSHPPAGCGPHVGFRCVRDAAA